MLPFPVSQLVDVAALERDAVQTGVVDADRMTMSLIASEYASAIEIGDSARNRCPEKTQLDCPTAFLAASEHFLGDRQLWPRNPLDNLTTAS